MPTAYYSNNYYHDISPLCLHIGYEYPLPLTPGYYTNGTANVILGRLLRTTEWVTLPHRLLH